MKLTKKILSFIMAASLCMISFTGCSSKKEASQLDIINGKGPSKGQTIATVKVKDFGEIKIALFKKVAPKGFENFVTHAKNGYYDGVVFHRVMKDFMIQGGDPEGTGMGGKSIWGDEFGIEVSKDYRHFTGALSYANAGGKNSSQFFIVNNTQPVTDDEIEMTSSYLKEKMNIDLNYSDKDKENYKKIGGTPFLDMQYTVFGQVYEGLDIVGKIMDIEVTENDMGEASAPKTPVVIETITISEYGKDK